MWRCIAIATSFIPVCIPLDCREYKDRQRGNIGVRARRMEGFFQWLENKVRELAMSGHRPSHEVVTMSKLPSTAVTEYPSMYANGYNFRPDNEDGHNHVTFDAGVAAIINQECRSSRADPRPVEATLKYVGILKKIVEINYELVKYVVLKCSWIRPHLGACKLCVTKMMASDQSSITTDKCHP